ncbi:pyrimidine 5'-nucleotidase [Lutibaculum baratangense]|uniref:Pyridoxal-5'-phosphate phosphatase, Alphaproteobacterial type n=1 Tax=Lutibaculum baratangense AMV1 TaxID=631454 RepID=V4RLT6_9HYPH|nr:pyrimidine 5'-nucleotidase [Lutibaculum baratangense]ESR26981.1 Pyridoxal-5'-phosphate phosphatase, Alphaproteobacterial type [Lutibaculum baratangense AMV1]
MASAHSSRAEDPLSPFDTVESWVFDLDNTLYPPRSNLFQQVDDRMGRFIAALLSCDRVEARRVQKDYYRRYGTTLRGLMSEHGIDPHDFLAFVHDIDHSPIEPDPALGSALALLPGRKFVLTNGSRSHAEAVLARLGIGEHFEDLFDIIAAEFEPKPARRPYESFLSRHGIEPARAAMFEDLPRNLEVPHELGMLTVLVTGDATETAGHRADWEQTTGESYVDHVTDDLAQFLVSVCERIGTGAPSRD